MSLTLSSSETAYLITQVVTLKPRYWENSVFVYTLVAKNNIYLWYVVVTNSQVEPLKSILSDYVEFQYILFNYFHINSNKLRYDE